MNIAVCDDNPMVLKEITHLIDDFAEKRGIFIRYDTYLDYGIPDEDLKQYDIFILDYDMTDYKKDNSEKCNGMDFARRIRKTCNSEKSIIFITAYPDFVYESFEVRTHRFIVKPVTQEKLFEALDNFIVDSSVANKLVVRSGRETFILNINDIYYIESIKKDAFIHIKGNIIKCNKRLTEFEKELSAFGFFKTHRSYLVNIEKIESFDHKDVYMANGDKVLISASNYSKLNKLYLDQMI